MEVHLRSKFRLDHGAGSLNACCRFLSDHIRGFLGEPRCTGSVWQAITIVEFMLTMNHHLRLRHASNIARTLLA